MATISLEHREVEVLVRLIDTTLPELRAEVTRTENFDLRKSLQEEEGALRHVREVLSGTLAGPEMHDF